MNKAYFASRNFEGACWKALACLCFALMNGLITGLMKRLHFLEVAFFEHILAIMWLAPFLWRYRTALLKTLRPAWHLWRVLLSVVGVILWYQALQVMPMAQAVALGFVGPITTSLGAVFLLKERLTKGRLLALTLGTLGVIFIQRSWCHWSWSLYDCWTLLPLGSSLAFSLSTLVSKKLTSVDHPLLIVVVLFVFMTPCFGVLAAPVFTMPSLAEWAVLVLLGGMTALAHFALTRSFVCSDVTYLLPIGALRFVFTACVGYIFFAQKPLLSVYLGFAVIFAALFVLSACEGRFGRVKKASLS